MKNIVYMISGVFWGLIALIIVMTFYGEMNRSMELKSNLPSLIEEVLEQQMEETSYGNEEKERFIIDFARKLAVTWENKSDMIIDVIQFRPEQGILSVRVTAKYKKPYGAVGMVKCERTVIFNR